ncbi:MAG: hypothetical protein JWO38_6355 [Gemmataceae bacterium]|nr:hypothetical protein [Gemmataceae bacterium]
MRRKSSETGADAAQMEKAYQRWADDGGLIPDLSMAGPERPITAVLRTPWAAIGVAVGLGFALGWITGRRQA